VFEGLDQDEQEQLAIIKATLQTIAHYFGRMAKLFGAVNDPRVPYLITYPLEALAFACQATIRFTHQRRLEMPMAKPYTLGLCGPI
jgi:hypothetical protein